MLRSEEKLLWYSAFGSVLGVVVWGCVWFFSGRHSDCVANGLLGAIAFSSVFLAILCCGAAFTNKLRFGDADCFAVTMLWTFAGYGVAFPAFVALFGPYATFLGASCQPWSVINMWEPWIGFSLFFVGLAIFAVGVFVYGLVTGIRLRCCPAKESSISRVLGAVEKLMWSDAIKDAKNNGLFQEPQTVPDKWEQPGEKGAPIFGIFGLLSPFLFLIPVWWRINDHGPVVDDTHTAKYIIASNVVVGAYWVMALFFSAGGTIDLCSDAENAVAVLAKAASNLTTVEQLELWNKLMCAWHNEVRDRVQPKSWFSFWAVNLAATALSSIALVVFMFFPKGSELLIDHRIVVAVVIPASMVGVLALVYVVWLLTGLHTHLVDRAHTRGPRHRPSRAQTKRKSERRREKSKGSQR